MLPGGEHGTHSCHAALTGQHTGTEVPRPDTVPPGPWSVTSVANEHLFWNWNG